MGEAAAISFQPGHVKVLNRGPGDGQGQSAAEGAGPMLLALDLALERVAQHLNDGIERAAADVDRISDLGRQLGWVSARQRLVRAILQSNQVSMEYMFSNCGNLDQLRMLAETAMQSADDGEPLSTAFNMLVFLDRELDWYPSLVEA